MYPQAKVVILGIMYENLYRMLNSYRPVLYEKAMDYGLKPYMADGDIQPHPGADAFASVDSFRGYAVDAFENDFWAKPDSSFPFSVALFRAVGTNYFLFRKFQKQFRRLGVPDYFLAFSQQRVTTQLLRLIGEFADYAVMAESRSPCASTFARDSSLVILHRLSARKLRCPPADEIS